MPNFIRPRYNVANRSARTHGQGGFQFSWQVLQGSQNIPPNSNTNNGTYYGRNPSPGRRYTNRTSNVHQESVQEYQAQNVLTAAIENTGFRQTIPERFLYQQPRDLQNQIETTEIQGQQLQPESAHSTQVEQFRQLVSETASTPLQSNDIQQTVIFNGEIVEQHGDMLLTDGNEYINTKDVETVAVKKEPLEELWDPNHWTAMLHCCVCFEYFHQAYVLGCGHSFCNKCLEMMVKTEHSRNPRRPYNFTPLICPTCRYTMPYQSYARYSPRNRALEAVIEAWKASGDRLKQCTPKVERGIQTNFEEEAADSIKQEAGEAPIDIAIQTDISPPMCKKDVGQQVSLQAPGQCSATQTSILTRSMLVQTKKQKYRNKDTQTKTTKCCTAEVQAGEPGFALKAPCLPKVNSASQCVRTTMDTRYTQTTSVKKKKSHTVKCQTVLQSSEHLRHRKGEQLGPWISCGQKPKPPSADPFFVMLAVLSIFIQLDWRDVTSKFVTDVPTVLRDDYYTWYTLRAMIESLSYLVYGCFSFFYIIGSLMRPSSRT